jgi:hypothetical protein
MEEYSAETSRNDKLLTKIIYYKTTNMKLFSSFILSLCSVLGFSQTILYQAESTSRTVQDPQTVILTKDFMLNLMFPILLWQKLALLRKIRAGACGSQAGAIIHQELRLRQDKAFMILGNIEVNGAGQLQFTLPIALPPGVKSVAPQINLVYTSGFGMVLRDMDGIFRGYNNIKSWQEY